MISNKMLDKRLRANPHFSEFLSSLMTVNNHVKGKSMLLEWLDVVEQTVENTTTRKLILFCEFTNNLIKRNILRSSRAASWLVNTDDYRFDFEMIDTSGGMIQEEIIAQNKRLKIITKILRKKLEESKRYKPIDISPAKKEIEYWRGGFHACNGCDADVAKKLGADLSLVGYVQKVSNLILNINVFMRDTKTGKLVEVQSVDVRGNTDETWTRSISYMIRNRILDDKWSHMKE